MTDDTFSIIFHLILLKKREHYQISQILTFSKNKTRQIQNFWEKFWWLLVTVVSEENDMKATTKQDLSHSHTAIQSEPCPRHEAELETYQLHNCEERRGHFTPKFSK